MYNYVPQRFFLTKGIGRHRDKLRSFELALKDAGISHLNLVKVSSILPPGCKKITKNRALKILKPGQITFCVMSECYTDEPNRLIAASVGLAIPADKTKYGYLSEYHAYGQNEKEAGDYAEDLAACMLAATLGIEVNEDIEWDERKKIWKLKNCPQALQ